MSDAAEWLTGVSTTLLVGGVVFAGAQFRIERIKTQWERTEAVLRQWSVEDITTLFYYADRCDDPNRCRMMANRAYRNARPARRAHFDDLLAITANTAHHTELMLRLDLIYGNILAQSFGQDILLTYFAVQDILVARARTDNFNFLGFWRLANALQPFYRNLPDDEVDDTLANCTFSKPVLKPKARPAWQKAFWAP